MTNGSPIDLTISDDERPTQLKSLTRHATRGSKQRASFRRSHRTYGPGIAPKPAVNRLRNHVNSSVVISLDSDSSDASRTRHQPATGRRNADASLTSIPSPPATHPPRTYADAKE